MSAAEEPSNWRIAGRPVAVELARLRVPHTVPVGDHQTHVLAEDCWCHPLRQPVLDVLGRPSGWLMVHNAADCRERFERQGVPTGKAWQLVVAVETIPVGVVEVKEPGTEAA